MSDAQSWYGWTESTEDEARQIVATIEGCKPEHVVTMTYGPTVLGRPMTAEEIEEYDRTNG